MSIKFIKTEKNLQILGRNKLFEKTLFLIIGALAITNLFLIILSIFYSTNLFNLFFEKLLELQGL